MLGAIRGVFSADINQSTWLGHSARRLALRKLHNMNFLVGGPDEFRDFNITLSDQTPLLTNMLAVREVTIARALARLQKPVSRRRWGGEYARCGLRGS